VNFSGVITVYYLL